MPKFNYFAAVNNAMSKISPLIAHYLQEKKSVSIEGFGRFFIDATAGYVDPSEKNAPTSPIQFEYDAAAKTDAEFITYIVTQTGKIKPLAIADLDTFLSLSKQLLNISKPLVIDGVGTLNKATAGHYEFIPGLYEAPKISTDNDRDRRLRQAKENTKESAVSFDTTYGNERRQGNNGLLKKILGALTLLLLLGGIGFAIYKFVFEKSDDAKTSTAAAKETTNTNQDTANKAKDTTTTKNIVTNTAPLTAPDSLGRVDFKLVVRTTDSIGAYKRYNQLKDYKENVLIEKTSNNQFKVSIVVKANPVDTGALRVKKQSDYPTQGQPAYYEKY